MSATSRILRSATTLIVAATLAGCVAQYRNHGYVPAEDDLSGIIVGVDTRDSIAETLGTPSSAGVIDEGTYYYVSKRVRHYGFQAPEIVDRQVVAISFDSRGVVRNIERFTLEDGQVVPLTQRVTDNNVRNTTLLRQLLGNLGRFDASTVLGDE